MSLSSDARRLYFRKGNEKSHLRNQRSSPMGLLFLFASRNCGDLNLIDDLRRARRAWLVGLAKQKQSMTVFVSGVAQSTSVPSRVSQATVHDIRRRLGCVRTTLSSPYFQIPSPQPKKFLRLVPRIFFCLFTFHSSLFTFLSLRGIFLEVISNSE